MTTPSPEPATNIQPHPADAVIIGGGPAGTAAAAALAQHGRSAIVLERNEFPRYRVGESLIPYCWFPLHRIGMIDKLKASNFINKYSVQFVSLTGKQSHPFYFSKHTNHDCANTYQVVRGEFDKMLADNAREKGAQILIGYNARQLLTDPTQPDRTTGVIAEDQQGNTHHFHAPITIDASGRDTFAINKNNWRIPDQKLKKIAVWTYYKGAMRDSGIDEGATTVAYLPEKGWFWYIPLPEDTVSVGIVAEKDYLYRGERDPKAIFHREADIQPWIKQHLEPGTQTGEYRVTGDYSYRAKHSAADGLVLTGDAFAFLDPVFSSGVFLALQTGVMAADAIHNALNQNDTSAEQFNEYAEKSIAAVEAMRKLVYAFYEHNFNFGDLLKKHPHLRPDLTDCLIGNLNKDFDPLFEAVAEFADVPEPLPHGRPLTKTPTPA